MGGLILSGSSVLSAFVEGVAAVIVVYRLCKEQGAAADSRKNATGRGNRQADRKNTGGKK